MYLVDTKCVDTKQVHGGILHNTSLCYLTLLHTAFRLFHTVSVPYFHISPLVLSDCQTCPSSTLSCNHCQLIQLTGLWKLFCLLSWRLQPPHGSKKNFPAGECKQESTDWWWLIHHLDMFQSRCLQPTLCICSFRSSWCSTSLHCQKLMFEITDSADVVVRLKAPVAHKNVPWHDAG